jgi:hypothetical protein
MPLKRMHSFVHASQDKVTSLTVSLAEDSVIVTMSDKIDKLRVKLDMDELAGLAEAARSNGSWSAFHSFKAEQRETKNRITFGNSFFTVEGEKRISLKLTDNERAAFARVLGLAFDQLVIKNIYPEEV